MPNSSSAPAVASRDFSFTFGRTEGWAGRLSTPVSQAWRSCPACPRSHSDPVTHGWVRPWPIACALSRKQPSHFSLPPGPPWTGAPFRLFPGSTHVRGDQGPGCCFRMAASGRPRPSLRLCLPWRVAWGLRWALHRGRSRDGLLKGKRAERR